MSGWEKLEGSEALAGLAHIPKENFPPTCSFSAGDKAKTRAPVSQRNEEAGFGGGKRGKGYVDGDFSEISQVLQVPNALGRNKKWKNI